MNPKVRPQALAKLVGKESHEPVTVKLRTTTPFTEEEIDRLTAWGAVLLYDSGIVAVVTLPAGRVDDLAGIEMVLEIL